MSKILGLNVSLYISSLTQKGQPFQIQAGHAGLESIELNHCLEFKSQQKLAILSCISRQIIVKFFKFVYFLHDIRLLVTQVTSNATSSGKIHCIKNCLATTLRYLIAVYVRVFILGFFQIFLLNKM